MSGAAEMHVDLPAGAGGPGWYELVVSGLDAEAARQITLVLEMSGEAPATWEYALPAVAGGILCQILHLERPVLGARLTSRLPLAGSVSSVLRPIGRAGVLARGLAIDREQTLAALRWRLLGKKVRSRNLLMRLFGLPRRMAYRSWLQRNEEDWNRERAVLIERLPAMRLPELAVIVHSCSAQGAAAATLASLSAQDLRPSRTVMVEHGRSLRETVASIESSWIILLPDGHTLAPDALLRIAARTIEASAPVALTWDSDSIDRAGGRYEPELKPIWNEALYLARDYVGPFAISRVAAASGLAKLPDLRTDLADFLLVAASRSGGGPVGHIARVISHRTISAPSECSDPISRRDLVETILHHEAPSATATIEAGGIVRAQFPVREPKPLVSLIVPTRDRLDLLEPCVSGLLHRTSYASIEVLIADNGSREEATLRYFARIAAADPRVRVVDCAGPFNFSAINNRAVRESRGSMLGFINNDIEVIGPEWLSEMVGHALRTRIGAVGARLLYASGLVQHAGVVLGVGGYAGHAHRFAHPGDWGYLGRLQAQQTFSAVTAACLVVEKRKFEAVGGFDETAFPVAYNDVDLCLRLRRAGYETLWTPYAELLHKESASRVRDYAPERRAAYEAECRAFEERWADLIADDPCYHPALSRTLENFSLE